MCGRFALTLTPETLREHFLLSEGFEFNQSYNIAPSQDIVAIRIDEKEAQRVGSSLKWGLIPFWAKDPKIGYKMINARSETAATKPSFRTAFKKRRCLIPTSGFYEWKRIDPKTKQPYYITPKGVNAFGFAGLWEHWKGPNGDVIESAAILTTSANPLMSKIHDRMPVILSASDYDSWLDPSFENMDVLQKLLIPCSDKIMKAYPVDPYVNKPANNNPKCIEPIGE